MPHLPASSPLLPVRIYSPEPALKRPGAFFLSMFRDIAGAGELAMAIARRDISAQYRNSFLGYFWAFLPILGTTGVFLFLKSGGAFQTGTGAIPYPVYVLVGTILWQLFVDAVNAPLKMVTSSRSMLVKINFPREALILAGMLITSFNFLIRLLVLIPALVFFQWKGMFHFSASALLLFPLGVCSLVLLGYTIGLLLTPVGMLYKDIALALSMVMMFWMFVSPVVVTIPESGMVSRLIRLNPVSPLLDTARSWLVGVPPDLIGSFWWVSLLSLIFFVIGGILFRVSLPHIIARLGM